MSISVISAMMNTVKTAAFGKPATLVNDAVNFADFMPTGFDAKPGVDSGPFEPSPQTPMRSRAS